MENFSLINPDDDDLPDNESAPPYPWHYRFVRAEVRPFLVEHQQVALEGLERWLARREDQRCALTEWQAQLDEYLRHLAAQPSDPWDESEPVGEGWEWRESWRDPSDKVLYRISNWLPPRLTQSKPSVDDFPLPPPRHHDLTPDECWAALLAVHDVVRISREKLVKIFTSDFDALCRRTEGLTEEHLHQLQGMLRAVMDTIPAGGQPPLSTDLANGAPMDGAASAAAGDDPTAYRPAKEFLDQKRYPSYQAIRKALQAAPWIRTQKPSSQRLNIHASDWQRMLNQPVVADPLDLPAETVDAAVKAVEQRKAEVRKTRK
jgi:hypothetical protein